MKANASEPLMTCRKPINDIKTEVCSMPREQPGGNLCTAQAVSGIQVARAWLGLWCGTWEPVALTKMAGLGVPAQLSGMIGLGLPARSSKGDPQTAETARGRVPMQGTGADRLVVAMKPGNAGGAKGAGRPERPCGPTTSVGGVHTAVRSRARLYGRHEPCTPRGVCTVL